MARSGTVTVKVTGDASNLKRVLGSAAGDLNSFGGIARGLGSGLMTVGKIGAAALGGVAVAGAAAVGWGVKLAADAEQARIGFTQLLGSGEKAEAFLKQLTDFAAKTPFEMEGLQETASQLLAVGVQADDVLPIMKGLGDATAGLGLDAEGLSRVTRGLTQSMAKGKVQTEEVLQIAETGIPIFKELAAQMGVSEGELSDLLRAGKVTPDILVKAFTAPVGPMKNLTGAMEKQSATFLGLWSTMKDTVKFGMRDTFQPFMELFRDLMPAAIEATEGAFWGLSAFLDPIMARLREVMATFVPLMNDLMEDAAFVWTEFADNIGKAVAAGDWATARAEFRRMIGEMLTGAGDVFAEHNIVGGWPGKIAEALRTGDWESAKAAFGDRLWEAVQTGLTVLTAKSSEIAARLGLIMGKAVSDPAFLSALGGGLVEGFTGLDLSPAGAAIAGSLVAATVIGIKARSPLIAAALAATFVSRTVQEKVKDAGNQASEGFGDSLSSGLKSPIHGVVEAWTGEFGQRSRERMGNVAEAVGRFFTETLPRFFSGLPEKIGSLFDGVGGRITGALGAVGTAIGNFFTVTVPQKFEEFRVWWDQIPTKIGDALYRLVTEVLPRWAGNVVQFFTETIPRWGEQFGLWAADMVDRFVVGIQALPGRVGTWLSETWNRLVQWAGQMLETARTKAGETVDAVVGWFHQLPGRIWQWLQDTINRVREWAGGLRREASDGAKSAIDTVVNWFMSLPGRIREWLAEVIQKVKNWAGDLGRAMTDAASRAWTNFKAALSDSPETKIEAWLAEMARNTRGIVDDMARQLLRLSAIASRVQQGGRGGALVDARTGLGLGVGLTRAAMGTVNVVINQHFAGQVDRRQVRAGAQDAFAKFNSELRRRMA